MLFSKSFIFTLREDPRIAECRSHKLLLKGSFISMVSSGVYSYLPLGQRVLNNITSIIRNRMDSNGAQELLMSALQPIEMWQKTGRDQTLDEVMFKFKDRKDKDVCLAPTHEEAITEIVRANAGSYKKLPWILYQIQTKFRDEPRPRLGLLRSCEFVMKDAYSFDKDQQGLDDNYNKMFNCYKEIFKDLELGIVATEADSGAMGGDISHEFMVPSEIGEDILFCCNGCLKYFKEKGTCVQCNANLEEVKMIEVGHIFKLGTKYSVAQDALFLDKNGKKNPLIMGCYGIGVSRILATIAEVSSDEKGIIWPKNVAPFDVTLVVLNDSLLEAAISLRDKLKIQGLSVLVDDRAVTAGVKFKDAYLIGNPYILIMGKTYLENKSVDIEIRKNNNKFNLTENEVLNFFKKEYDN
ncbi:MAG: proline--tRNA ligase [Candidatus Omnitrophica bacterium]|nr:proline--tRNA ligase [Candidatus Omnitrophota bacterium]